MEGSSMERLVAMYRVSSSAGAVVSLVVANLIPLAGVLFWGWDLWTILALYWVENGIVGVYNVARILKAEGPDTIRLGAAGARLVAPSRDEAAAAGLLGRAGTASFFVVHYGMFWLVHGIFVLFVLPAFAGFGSGDVAFGLRARMDLVVLGAIALAISHGVSFWLDFIGRGEYRRVSPRAQMAAPYGRLVILHMTIILGAFLSAMVGAPVGAMFVLVSLKLALDLALHIREHRAPA